MIVVVALTYANRGIANEVVQEQYKEIVDEIMSEKEPAGQTLSVMQVAKTLIAKKRMLLPLFVAVFSTLSGTRYRALHL